VTRIGCVGLGRMGRPMAMNLARHGADLTACATRAASLAPFREAGVRATTDLSDVVPASVPSGLPVF